MTLARITLVAFLVWSGTVLADPILDRGGWTQVLASLRHRPAIVHFWGVTCAPCMAELPKWGAFVKAHPGLKVIMVQADPVTVPPRQIRDRLAKAGLADAENMTLADVNDERLHFEIDPDWQGETPFTVLIGKDGSTRSTIGESNFKALNAWAAAAIAR